MPQEPSCTFPLPIKQYKIEPAPFGAGSVPFGEAYISKGSMLSTGWPTSVR